MKLRLLYSVGALLVAFGLLRFSFYLAPNWEQMAYAGLKSIPGSQYVINPGDAGLFQLAQEGKIQAMDITASDNGLAVHVLGTYADSIRTTLFLRVDQPDVGPPEANLPNGKGTWMPDLQHTRLTDQFGHSYTPNSSMWNSRENSGNIEFTGIPSWKLALGVRLHLSIQDVQWVPDSGKGFRDVKGLWNANWIQVSEGRERVIQANTTATSNGVQIWLKTIELSPSATKLDVSSVNAREPGLSSSAVINRGRTNKPLASEEFYVEQVSTGERYHMLSTNTTGYGPYVTEQIVMTPLPKPGKYVLVIQRFNGIDGTWELPFTIP